MKATQGILSATIALLAYPNLATAQSIVVAPDGTGTVITQTGDRFTISGGSVSADGHNLFHSFEQFGLQRHEVANFLANPAHHNILARVVGGDPSIINGRLGIIGASPNLYLMNPAGVVFGAHAQLNFPADFTATTATGIEFEQGVFSTANSSQNYAALVGKPQAFTFEQGKGGAIANAGNLQVAPGRNLSLIGGTVLNTGNLIAKGGNLQVIGVPGTNRVKISQTGNLLSLEIATSKSEGALTQFNPLDLPQLLTGSQLAPDSMGVEFGADGKLYSPGSSVPIPTSPGAVTITGKVDASTDKFTTTKPQIHIDGDRIALMNADIDASGVNGGGKIRIGENSQRTFVDRKSTIQADAIGSQGHGGDILVWADEITAFYGTLSAQGGSQGGDGGFVEVSAQESLAYDGRADLDAPSGEAGTLFLDPTSITIVASPGTADDANLPNIFASQSPGLSFTISDTALNTQTGTVILEATSSIVVNATLNLMASHLILRAPSINVNQPITGDSFTIAADASSLNIPITSNTNMGTLTLTTFSPSIGLRLGGTGDLPNIHDIGDNQLAQFSGFNQIVLDNTGLVRVENTATVQTTLASAALAIVGAEELQGFDANTTWELTGANQGQFNTFGQTINFSNVSQITGGTGQDTFIFNDGVDFNGILDGGAGFDRLDYSRFTTLPTINLAANQATGTTGVFNIEDVTLPSNPPLPTTVTNPNLNPLTPLDPILNPNDDGNNRALAILDRDAIGTLLDSEDVEGALISLDTLFGTEIMDYLGKSNTKGTSLTEIQGILREQSAATQSPSAMIYALVRSQYLELILVTEVAEPIHYQIPVAAPHLLATVGQFRQEITDPVRRLTNSYLPSAQQLHQWLIDPLQADLARFGIETLIFSLDQGLRALPLAALHNGQGFLIEDYGLSVVPSLALTRTERTPLREARVLAMGASEFRAQRPLPAVPVEIAAVTENIRQGVDLINEQFTWYNWQQQQQEAFNVVHIATHAEFRPGPVDNSYIQLWDEQVGLDQIGSIPWRDQAVELLVLSACRTAFGSTEAEFGFAGLAVQTGVPAAIASIWYAHDVGTLALMSELYRHLPNTTTRAQALRQAQLALLHQETQIEAGQLTSTNGATPLPGALMRIRDRPLHHPYYWSGFTLIGSPW
ncbi:MAG: CHAT domain-containing protein [Spirulina sp. SIO3F2]|nr:CHAT domain-containing protein [Spirulina sp. SIO3F2]